MTGPPEKISGRAILSDIRAGMDNNSLMKKYRLTGEQLKRVLKKLLDAKVLGQAEYESRVPPEPKKLVPTFTCTECGSVHSRRFIRCPVCKVKAPSFRYEEETEPSSGARLDQKPAKGMCWFCGKEPASEKASVFKTLIAHYKAFPNGIITFDDTGITIPRCAICQSNQAKIDSLEVSIKELDSEIAREQAAPNRPVRARTEKAQPSTVVMAIAGGVAGFWMGVGLAKVLGLANLWSQVALGASLGLVVLMVVFVALDSWLLPRIRRARRSRKPGRSGSDRELTPPARIALLMEQRGLLNEERSRLIDSTRPLSEWGDFPEARILLQNGWEDDLDRPGLGAFKLKKELASRSKTSLDRKRN
ncbi:MAG: hypothetical protein AB1646_18800 [Thermodesulfobacteriota bacterium]